MSGSFEHDENLDVLQNIEFAIVSALKNNPNMDDNDVMGGLDAAIRNFRDLERERKPREPNLDAVTAEIFNRVRALCLIRMRPVSIIGKDDERDLGDDVIPESQLLPVETISRCLKKIRKSVDNWHGVGGRRGYLEFVLPYFASALADDNDEN